jgi:hypothetical protein
MSVVYVHYIVPPFGLVITAEVLEELAISFRTADKYSDVAIFSYTAVHLISRGSTNYRQR